MREVQAMARHSTPTLTMERYGVARVDRLGEIAERAVAVIPSR